MKTMNRIAGLEIISYTKKFDYDKDVIKQMIRNIEDSLLEDKTMKKITGILDNMNDIMVAVEAGYTPEQYERKHEVDMSRAQYMKKLIKDFEYDRDHDNIDWEEDTIEDCEVEEQLRDFYTHAEYFIEQVQLDEELENADK